LNRFIKLTDAWGAWVAQSVGRPGLDSGSGRGVGFVGSSAVSGSMLGGESA